MVSLGSLDEWVLFSFDKHFLHQHSTLPRCLVSGNVAYLCIDLGPLDWILSHGVRRSHFPESIPWINELSSWACWQVPIFCGFLRQTVRWYELQVNWILIRHPSCRGHIHKSIHFPQRHATVPTRWGSGRGSSWNDSFQGDTIGYSSASHADLWSSPFWWQAWWTIKYKN